MIKITTLSGSKYELKPTMFPDGTSQVWKLPDEVFASKELEITWNFEAERELIDLLSLRELLPDHAYAWDLHIPFLPYARQDKEVSNASTFNLKVLAGLINSLGCTRVTSVDTHNPERTKELFFSFENIEVTELHKLLVNEIQPNYIVFPDLGAKNRYFRNGVAHLPRIIFDKVRDQLTGEITGHTMSYRDLNGVTIQDVDMARIANKGDRFLIIDDLCDGGATFISIAQKLRSQIPDIKVDLYVTHGVFSKGRENLTNNGINSIYTTNSLIKNGDGYQV
jgi:ribose-phosphate pyrophosphokinase